MHKVVSVFIVCFFISTASLAGDPRAHIDETVIKFVAAFNAGDAATVAGFYSEDGAVFPPGGARADGRAAIQQFWQGAIDSGMKIDDLHAVEVDARQDLASEVGVFTLSVPGEGGTMTKVSGKYIVTWKRAGHTWQLYRDIWNTN